MMSSPSSPQQFCLRWNNHQSALVSVFDNLLQNEAFVDVTFAVEGILVRAHKLVLSACSPYFQVMLASHPSKHPIIILQEVCYSDFRALLDFMYKGEVAVDQDRLPAFLRLAENLKIRGLAEFCDESNTSSQSEQQTSHGSEARSSPGFVFDSLLDNQGKIQPGKPSGSAGVEVLPRNPAFTSPLPVRRPDVSPVEYSLATFGLFNTPLAFAAHKNRMGNRNLSSSSSKWPLEPQTYAHHRRKRGRPPRHTGLNRFDGSSGSDPTAHKAEKNMDSCSSDIVHSKTSPVDENSDSVHADGNLEHAQTEESEVVKSVKTDNDCRAGLDEELQSSSPVPESHLEVALDEDVADRTDNGEPVPGTSHQGKDQEEVSGSQENKVLLGKIGKRPRGRPRYPNFLDDTAGPSQDSVRPAAVNTEQLQEMSVRGLNLFRYATISEEGVYRCIPCEKEQITRTFKNKYSFQRHAYLYHEGNQRKVFPCLVCGREFSRPDKLKHHLKTVHDYAVPREYGNAYYSVP